jgi:segregation and condensation protein B
MTEEMNTQPVSPQTHSLKSILESLLLVSDKPIPRSQLILVLDEFSETQVDNAIEAVRESFSGSESGISLVEVAGGYQLRSKAENSPWIFKLNKARPVRLSRASLETLAIVAYRQPVTRPEIDDIRGVDSGPVLKHLLERNLVKILGKREEPGSPLIYGTTKDFLSFFSLNSLADLPSLREYTELGEESLAKLEQLLPSQSESAPAEEATDLTDLPLETALGHATHEPTT